MALPHSTKLKAVLIAQLITVVESPDIYLTVEVYQTNDKHKH